MAKRIKDKNLELALKFRDHLLWELMGDNMGKKPDHKLPENTTTFSEKKAFLDSMLKAAEQARKSVSDQEPESIFDKIRKNANGGRTGSGGGDSGGTESVSDESEGSVEEDSES